MTSENENKNKNKIIVNSHGKGLVGINFNHAQMVQWDRSDYEQVNKYYQLMNELTADLYRTSQWIRDMKIRLYNSPKTFSETDRATLKQLEFAYKNSQHSLNALIDNLEGEIFRYKDNDKHNGFLLVQEKVEPQKIVIKENSLVNPALVIYAKQIASQSTEEFRYIASGVGSLPTKPNQNALQSENSRLDIFINGGFRNPNGDVVREGVIFPPGLADATVTEFGSFTDPEAGDMQWRNVIEEQSEQIEHDQGATFYSIAHVTVLQINYIE
jgi:hypothetical protein